MKIFLVNIFLALPKVFPLITKVFHLVTKIFSVVTKVLPLVTKVTLLHMHPFEVKCDERTHTLNVPFIVLDFNDLWSHFVHQFIQKYPN